jgi:FkbM family methyltransferase
MGLFAEKYRKFTRYFYGTGASKIPLVKKVHSSILQSTVPEFITIYGYKMFLDQSDDTTSYSLMLDFETNEKKILSKYISEGDVVVDVGACLGYYTLFFRSLVGKTGKVIAFEPDPRYFTLLQKTINANKFENVEIYQKAVGNKNSKIKLLSSDQIGQSQISDHGDIDIDCIRLDDYINSANFVKLDVEGYEIEIFKGMSNLLHQKIILMSEFYVKLLANHSNPAEFFITLAKNGFSFNDMRNNMQSIDESNFMLKYNKESGATNILCIKK